MKKNNVILILAIALVTSFHSNAAVTLPKLISDNMVLQRDAEVKIWGWADPHERVTVRLDNNVIGSVSSGTRQWELTLPAQAAGGTHRIDVSGSNNITINNVTFGEVWLASGQSNMVLTTKRVKDRYPDVVAKADFADIRYFNVPVLYNFTQPEKNYPAIPWQSVNPESVMSLSATSFFFARDLYQRYQVPIGIISASVGGSPIEAWMSREALARFPVPLAKAAEYQNKKHLQRILDADKQRRDDWYTDINQRDVGLAEHWSQSEYDDYQWQLFTLPGYWADQQLAKVNGVFWLRKTIDVPADIATKPVQLMMGNIVDVDIVYVNGVEVGSNVSKFQPREYSVPADVLTVGRNVISIRVINLRGKGGFIENKPYWLGTKKNHIDLKGEWQFKVGAEADVLPIDKFIRKNPTGYFNAMIAPATPYTIKGIIWYQGESNTHISVDYRALFTSMIQDWRLRWGKADLPFLYVQLANYMPAKAQPSESLWAEIREDQRLTLSLSNTAMAVIIDAGEADNIHPLNKYAPGHRLALAAQHGVYADKELVYSGPQISRVVAKRNSLLLSFSHIGSGLVAKNGELKEFAIAGIDGKFVWAKAEIVGDNIKVWNADITAPVSVRYAWADNPEQANLYNQQGLPASPFQINVDE